MSLVNKYAKTEKNFEKPKDILMINLTMQNVSKWMDTMFGEEREVEIHDLDDSDGEEEFSKDSNVQSRIIKSQ